MKTSAIEPIEASLKEITGTGPVCLDERISATADLARTRAAALVPVGSAEEVVGQPVEIELTLTTHLDRDGEPKAVSDSSRALSDLRLESDSVASTGDHYGPGVFWRHAKSIPWRLGGAAAVITATGVANWNWFSSPFRFQGEGWFGKDTHNSGMDKLGHAYSAFVLADFLTDGINNKWGESRSTAYSGALLSMGLMTYIEVFDGFSKDHGFSHEDLAMDAAGALFSVARRSIPGLREKLDFRLLYQPSGGTVRALLSCFPKPHCDRNGRTFRSPITDYRSQRYLFALKLAGFGRLADTPLRLLELHAGYYARGFTREEEERGDPLRRRLFIGAGLNVSELLFPGRTRGIGKAIKSALEYLQVPYTAVHSN